MVTEGYSDMEAETLRRIRDRFPDVPVMAVLDLHANFSAEACAHCDAVVGYRTYPHVDMADCGRETAALMRRALAGERFVTAYGKLGALTTPLAQGSANEPMRGLIQRADSRTMEAGAERVSLLPGFPYSDVARCGFAVLAVATTDKAKAAIAVVGDTLDDVERHLGDFAISRSSPADAVAEALRQSATPVILADVADNVGGGSPGDGTTLLAELIAQKAQAQWSSSPTHAAVAEARRAGTGNELSTPPRRQERFTTRCANRSSGGGEPTERWRLSHRRKLDDGPEFSMGPTAVLELDEGITVVINSRATPPFHIEQLTSIGIDPRRASIIVAKGAIAWRAAYERSWHPPSRSTPRDAARLTRTDFPA